MTVIDCPNPKCDGTINTADSHVKWMKHCRLCGAEAGDPPAWWAEYEAEITELLNRLPEIRWDRMTISEEEKLIRVYGWHARKCRRCGGSGKQPTTDSLTKAYEQCRRCAYGLGLDPRKDFVLLDFYMSSGTVLVGLCTSSPEFSEEIVRRLHGEDALEEHVSCERVENVLGGVKTAIKIEGSEEEDG